MKTMLFASFMSPVCSSQWQQQARSQPYPIFSLLGFILLLLYSCGKVRMIKLGMKFAPERCHGCPKGVDRRNADYWSNRDREYPADRLC
jgi:hypothetical protein